MGYYTTHSLDLEGAGDEFDNIIADLRENNECAEYALDENGDAEESCKWYDSSKDLKEFSKKYPDVLFTLHGEGEEPGDLWNEYFKNGKNQHCAGEITYPPCTL